MINPGLLAGVLKLLFDTFLVFFLHVSAKEQLLYFLFKRRFLTFLN